MNIRSLDKVEKIEANMEGTENVYKRVPISRNDGSPVFSFRVFTIGPGGHTPFHRHPFEHLNYIIAGRDVIINESGQEHEVKKGDFILVLPDEKHQYKNNQYKNKYIIEPMVMICAVPKEYE